MRTSRRSIGAAPHETRRGGVVRVLPVVVLAALSLLAALVGFGGPASGAGGGTFTATLTGAQEVPPVVSTATGSATVTLNTTETMITVNVVFSGLIGGPASAAHIQGPAAPGTNGPVVITLASFPSATSGNYLQSFAITPTQVSELRAGLLYVNIHNNMFPGGEIRGQLTEVQAPPTSGTAPGSAPEPIATSPSFTG